MHLRSEDQVRPMSGLARASQLATIVVPGGTSLAYETFGQRSDPPILLIQGLSAQMLGWHPEFCAMLAESGFFVVRFDNRDVGRSQRFPGRDYRISDMARDAAGLIEALGYDSMHIVGQSMGGMIAQRLAVEHRNRVRSLCLIYTVPSLQYFLAAEIIAERGSVPTPTTRAEAVELYVRNEEPCGSPGYPTNEEWLRELGGLMWDRGYDIEGVQRQTRAIEAQPDLRDGLDGIAVPTLLLHGDSDRLLSHAGSEELARTIPGAELRVYPGMGHQLPPALWPDMVSGIVANMRAAG